MASTFSGVITVQANGSYRGDSEEAFDPGPCPNCGNAYLGVVARAPETGVLWLRCSQCQAGAVSNDQRISPATLPLAEPLGVDGVQLDAWNEVRACLSVGAYTAAVMVARKLLLNVAVSHGLAPKNAKDRAPTFVEAIEFLEAEGVVTKKMRPWVDRIKDVGNVANHDIAPVSKDAAFDVGRFTEQLLRLAYEMDALMIKAESPE